MSIFTVEKYTLFVVLDIVCAACSVYNCLIKSWRTAMIRIGKDIEKKQGNFWNNALFHPTDAVEDPWGKRILDKIAEDKAARTIRIYAMLEDIVYYDGNGKLCFDFRLSDLRLDYLVDLGYELIIAYGGMPDCISRCTDFKSSNSNRATRYKGKMWNTYPPKDAKLWESVCYEYSRHLIERYGIDTVSKWSMQCFNEPDASGFFLSDVTGDEAGTILRCEEYCKMYEAFERGLKRAHEKLRIGGPAISCNFLFLESFLRFVREKNLRLDYIALHNYGTTPKKMLDDGGIITVNAILDKQEKYLEIIRGAGFGDTEIIVDEWGVASGGFRDIESCPPLIFRENEVFSAYYVKLISEFIARGYKVSKLLICLSGQHEMKTDFTGFCGFFTLNFIKKPIYNAFVLAAKLYEGLVSSRCENENITVIPTKDEKGNYAVLLSYCDEFFTEKIGDTLEKMSFDEELSQGRVQIYRIDKNTTNPYRVYEKFGKTALSDEDVEMLRREGELEPVYVGEYCGEVELSLTPNSTYLVTVNKN